jgi:2-methylaconitate cis-trans-isomerase PrpF
MNEPRRSTLSQQIAVRCTLMRGGTSKAVFLNENQVPLDVEARQRFLLALFGSPDKRQIDGLGGADPLTSKCAIIAPPSRPDADIDYTFVQIGIEEPVVSQEIVCGNISSATGVYAIEEGFVQPQEPVTTVRVHNTNTGKILRIKVQVRNGMPLVDGDFAIDGVPGTGAEVALDYSDTTGGSTGKLLPMGRVRDAVYVPSLKREVEVSIVDVGTVCAFFRAADLELTGTELPEQFSQVHHQAAEEIRLATAALCGLPTSSVYTPYQIMVGPAADYTAYGGGQLVRAEDIDFVARMIGRHRVHKAFPGGGSTCIAVAAQIDGTIVHECSSTHESPRRVRIGHPSGVLPVYSHVQPTAAGWEVREVHFSRTVRRLMDGQAYISRRLL